VLRFKGYWTTVMRKQWSHWPLDRGKIYSWFNALLVLGGKC